VKAGDAVLSLTEGWFIERFVAVEKKGANGRKTGKNKKPASRKTSRKKKA
jgi:hypothetical protein